MHKHERLRQHWQRVLCRRAGGLSATISWQGRGFSSREHVYSVKGIGKQVNTIDQAEEETQYVSAIGVLFWSAQWRHHIQTPSHVTRPQGFNDGWIFLKMFVFLSVWKRFKWAKTQCLYDWKAPMYKKTVHLKKLCVKKQAWDLLWMRSASYLCKRCSSLFVLLPGLQHLLRGFQQTQVTHQNKQCGSRHGGQGG